MKRRRAHVVHPRGDARAFAFAQQLFNCWSPKILAPLAESVLNLEQVLGLSRGRIELELVRTDEGIRSPTEPVQAIVHYTSGEASAFRHEYRIFVGIEMDPGLISSSHSKPSRQKTPSLLAFVSVGRNLQFQLSDEVGLCPLEIRCQLNLESVAMVIHDLALECYCCIHFLDPFMQIDPSKRVRFLKHLGALKCSFFRSLNLRFYGQESVLRPQVGYIPFTCAARSGLSGQIDYGKLAAIWVKFQNFVLEQQIPSDNLAEVETAGDIVSFLRRQREYRKLIGTLSVRSLLRRAESELEKHGPGDFALLIAVKRPHNQLERKQIAARMKNSNAKWRNYMWRFERFSSSGYDWVRNVVRVIRFRKRPNGGFKP